MKNQTKFKFSNSKQNRVEFIKMF